MKFLCTNKVNLLIISLAAHFVFCILFLNQGLCGLFVGLGQFMAQVARWSPQTHLMDTALRDKFVGSPSLVNKKASCRYGCSPPLCFFTYIVIPSYSTSHSVHFQNKIQARRSQAYHAMHVLTQTLRNYVASNELE